MGAKVLPVVGTKEQTQTVFLSVSTADEIGLVLYLSVGERAAFLGGDEVDMFQGKVSFQKRRVL